MSFSSATIQEINRRLRHTFDTGKTLSMDWRIGQLNRIEALLTENHEALSQALKLDLGVNEAFSSLIELKAAQNELKEAKEHVHEWVKEVAYANPPAAAFAKSYCKPEPYGLALIISPWNYPVSLIISPLIAAICAGNCVVIKPSEVSVNVSAVISKLIPKYLDNDCFAVVEGDAGVTSLVLAEKYDIIFYTGNTEVGRIVMQAAAKYLTPVVLELGGKNPTIVTADANLKVAARRIVWGKLSNMKEIIAEFYTKDPKTSSDYSRIINERHCKRLANLLDDSTIQIVHGGVVDVAQRFISPTIALVKPESKLMESEIFGPIIAVLSIKDVDEAIRFINAREKPLALYLFSSDQKTQEKVISRTSSGGVAINDTIMQIAGALPFGGVGSSGMGAYHSKAGFDAFSHYKPIFRTGTFLDPSLRYPPYTPEKLRRIHLIETLQSSRILPYVLAGLVVVAAVARSRM